MKNYTIIGWQPNESKDTTMLNIPVPDSWWLRVSFGTCAVFKRSGALGGGTIEKREKETIFDPPQLKFVYQGTLEGKTGKFTVVCEASEEEIREELLKDQLVFA